jgi:hypothetical protein
MAGKTILILGGGIGGHVATNYVPFPSAAAQRLQNP